MVRRAFAETGRGCARRFLAMRARDLTADLADASYLVVAPHPDDETLGCGATIARAAAGGAAVTVVVVSDGSRSHVSPQVTPSELAAIRRQEARDAVRTLGRVELIFLDFPDGELSTHVDAVSTAIRAVLSQVTPSVIMSPALAEPPPDHSAVALAVRRAWSTLDQTALLLEYPIWLWSTWPWVGSGSAAGRLLRTWSEIFAGDPVRFSTEGGLDIKRRALSAYRTQTTQFRDDPNWQPLPAPMVERFFGPHELFFAVPRTQSASVRQ